MIRRRFVRFVVLCALMALFFPSLAFAAEAAQIVISDPTGGLLSLVPGGIYIYGLLAMIAGLVSVFVKDSAMPAFLAKIVNLLALNVGKAKNDPGAN